MMVIFEVSFSEEGHIRPLMRLLRWHIFSTNVTKSGYDYPPEPLTFNTASGFNISSQYVSGQEGSLGPQQNPHVSHFLPVTNLNLYLRNPEIKYSRSWSALNH